VSNLDTVRPDKEWWSATTKDQEKIRSNDLRLTPKT